MTGKVNRDLFFKLASDLREERLHAAVALIKDLSALDLPDDAEEWSYVLNRLIKGLSSDRNSARLGFSLCLTEVINLAVNMPPGQRPKGLESTNEFLSTLSTILNVNVNEGTKKSMKGKDERGILFGKLFGLKSLLNEPLFSEIFVKDLEKGNTEFFIRFTEQLIDLALKKNWIKEPCFFTLFQTMKMLLPFMDESSAEKILLIYDKYDLTLTNEGLSTYLLLKYEGDESLIPSVLDLKNPGWKDNDPLARGNLPLLTKVLRNSSVIPDANGGLKETKKQKNTNWNPRLHFVWSVLLPLFGNGKLENTSHISKKRKKTNNKKVQNSIQFPEFWKMAVDESFFNEKASSERKYLGFLIIDAAFKAVPGSYIGFCFSQNVMRTLINQSIDSQRVLNKISQLTLDFIVKACEEDSANRLVPCLNAMLFGPHGSINFDKLTKSGTVSKLIAIKELPSTVLAQLLDVFLLQLQDKKGDLSHTLFALDSILHIVRAHKVEINDMDIMKPVLRPIVYMAFFKHTSDDLKLEQLHELAKERLYSILGELTINKEIRCKDPEINSWQYLTLKLILDIENSHVGDLINPLDENLENIKNEAISCLSKVCRSRTAQSWGLSTLLSMCLVQLYAGDTDSISVIEELCEFSKHENNSMVGITEILLSLLAQKKALLRKLSLIIWQQFIEEVGLEELQILLDILKARENKQGFAQLFEGEEEFEEIKEEDDASEDESKTGSESESESESESDSDDADEKDEEDEANEDILNIDKEATSALVKALNLPDNIVNDKGEVDLDQLEGLSDDGGDDEDEESMDDEKMMELDDQLSEIFKRRKEALSSISTGNQRKFEVKQSRENVISFKHRVVDMLAVYVKYCEKLTLANKSEHSNNLGGSLSKLVYFIIPMLKCVNETLDRPLADKISKLLKGKIFKIKVTAFKDMNKDIELMDLLKKTHKLMLTSKPGQHAAVFYSMCSTSSLFLSKLYVEIGGNDKLDELIDLYTATTKEWMQKGKCGPNIFIDFINWLSSKKQTVMDKE
ncbi:BBT_HP_G0126380.mRNA.1.CDS.1 [Saccharomyces cerevisiae]|nr:BBT_HP_G0114250.mRNA.1.CDS.1 [Saccharomyces cerevisiae]CAI5088851.1 BBT_HP_G0126380.mRNA.1.CDS.1 [Saccharomyces cerevisiae]CAI6954643.1 BBT_HP_G0114250.mRNA.1.CDS.1 [Saccharomyces cerevisiae]CAI6970114.1 BBT_HP_G0126380.mRNA.1.CDS.1 [Saccharomyces cerevisiae]CAI7098211.1 BBT_collapsed_G0014340.mRNA.1.CDS.1 [Saccharomyces cerevisiae]